MISFGVWSPDEDTFWLSWIAAGICTDTNVFTPGHHEIQLTAGVWSGTITKQTGIDENGDPILEEIPGWHCNVRVFGDLEAMFRSGKPQTDENGNPLDVFASTWAAEAFGLTDQPADEITGFPAGMRNSYGVVYADSAAFSSPANVWQ